MNSDPCRSIRVFGAMTMLAVLFPYSASTAAPPPYEQWSRSISTPQTDFASRVSADALGNVYALGYTGGQLGQSSAGGYDAFLRKFNPNGTVLWTRQFGLSQHDAASSLHVSSAGDVVIAGSTDGPLGGPSLGSTDGFIRKYNSSGALMWTTQFGSPVVDAIADVDLNSANEIFVGGYRLNFSPYEIRGFISKFSAGGASIWSRTLSDTGEVFANGVAADIGGNMIVAGQASHGTRLTGSSESGRAFVAKYDGAGSPIWIRQFGGDTMVARDVEVDAIGNSYVVGERFVNKFDPTGSLLWSRSLNQNTVGSNVALDGSGLIYVGCYGMSAYRIYDDAGTFLGARAPNTDSAYPTFVSPDGLGNILTYRTVSASNDFDTTLYKHTGIPEPGSLTLALILISTAHSFRLRRASTRAEACLVPRRRVGLYLPAELPDVLAAPRTISLARRPRSMSSATAAA